MPFGISTDGFWGKKELSYQHVHMFWSFWISFIVYNLSHSVYAPIMCGMLCGALMEAYQYRKYIIALEKPRTWKDSLRDLCFWIIGGCLNYILIFMSK
jgi:hypothetical protein